MILEQLISDLTNKAFGGSRPIYVNDTNLHNYVDVNIYCIQVLEDATFDSKTVLNCENGAGIVTDGLPKGVYYFQVHALKLATGKVILYKYK